MKFLNFNHVLSLSPHPDDVEFGMMGTILKYTDTKFDILCISQGGNFDDTTSINRLDEVKNVWNNYPNVTLHFTDKKFIEELRHDAWVNYIETNYLSMINYDCLFIPTNEDSHFEHKLINELAAPLARLKNLSIIEYRTPSTLDSWLPNIFVDITDYFDNKCERLMQFVSQNNRWYFKTELLQSFHSNFQSYKKGIKYTEKFRAIQLYKL